VQLVTKLREKKGLGKGLGWLGGGMGILAGIEDVAGIHVSTNYGPNINITIFFIT